MPELCRFPGTVPIFVSAKNGTVPFAAVLVDALGTAPIFVSAKMGLSPLPGDSATITPLTQNSVQVPPYKLTAMPTKDPKSIRLPSSRPSVPAAALITATGVIVCGMLFAADGTAPPRVSTFAPAEDLANQADSYIKYLEEAVASEEEYGYDVDKIAKQSNTLAVIALAIGLNDQPSKYTQQAGALMKAAQAVAAAKDYASAKRAVAELRSAADGKVQANVALKWEKVAALRELMLQVPVVNQKLRLGIAPARIKRRARMPPATRP